MRDKREEGVIRRAREVASENFWRVQDFKDMVGGEGSEAYGIAVRQGFPDDIARNLKGDSKDVTNSTLAAPLFPTR